MWSEGHIHHSFPQRTLTFTSPFPEWIHHPIQILFKPKRACVRGSNGGKTPSFFSEQHLIFFTALSTSCTEDISKVWTLNLVVIWISDSYNNSNKIQSDRKKQQHMYLQKHNRFQKCLSENSDGWRVSVFCMTLENEIRTPDPKLYGWKCEEQSQGRSLVCERSPHTLSFFSNLNTGGAIPENIRLRQNRQKKWFFLKEKKCKTVKSRKIKDWSSKKPKWPKRCAAW